MSVCSMVCLPMGSPASNGGRGLKPVWRGQGAKPGQGSPASNGGRGLKLYVYHPHSHRRRGFARQQWRARIETNRSKCSPVGFVGFARQQWRARIETRRPEAVCVWAWGFARQQWRARIETASSRVASPACGGFARQQWRARIETLMLSPPLACVWWVRPPAMAGAD